MISTWSGIVVMSEYIDSNTCTIYKKTPKYSSI